MPEAMTTIVPEFEIPKGVKPAQVQHSPSATRWIWQPLRDIDLKGHAGLNKLFGKGDQFYHKIERGKVYPLFDVFVFKTIPPEGDSANALNIEGGTSTGLRQERVTHYAYDCAEDFKMSYADITGGVIFESMTGMDREQVSHYLTLVLPQIYTQLTRPGSDKTGTWIGDLQDGGGADQRIKAAKMNDVDRQRAQRLRREALAGMVVAVNVAQDSRRELIKSMAQASIGRSGQSRADAFDEAMAELLALPVPTSIASEPGETQPQSTTSDAVLQFLMQQAEKESARDAQLAQMQQELEKLRAKEKRPVKAKDPLDEEE